MMGDTAAVVEPVLPAEGAPVDVRMGDCAILLSDYPPGVFQTIYCDPPYNTGNDFGDWCDRYGTLDEYVAWMRTNLRAILRTLRPDGSVFLHCDPTISPYLRVALDDIIGRAQFRNEIVWSYPPTGRAPEGRFPSKHDTILFYARPGAPWYPPVVPLSAVSAERYSVRTDADGRRFGVVHGRRVYLDDRAAAGTAVSDHWSDIPSAVCGSRTDRTGWATEKPVALVTRILRATTAPGDLVCDPFAGSGTTGIAAIRTGRRAVLIDQSPDACDLMRRRLRTEPPPLPALAE